MSDNHTGYFVYLAYVPAAGRQKNFFRESLAEGRFVKQDYFDRSDPSNIFGKFRDSVNPDFEFVISELSEKT